MRTTPAADAAEPPAPARPDWLAGTSHRDWLLDGDRIRGAYREDARHPPVALEHGEQCRVDRRSEAVEHAHVGLFGIDGRAA